MKILFTELISFLQSVKDLILQEILPEGEGGGTNSSLNLLLLQIPFFRTLDPKKDSFQISLEVLKGKFETILSLITNLLSLLLNQRELNKENLLFFNFPNEKSFGDFLLTYLNSPSMFPILTKELYKGLKAKNQPKLAFELIKLHFYGFSIPSDDIEDYPLHSGLFTKDLTSYQALIDSQIPYIDCLDPFANTPYKLALALQKFDLAKALLQRGCDPKLRAFSKGTSGFEDTLLWKDRELLKEAFRAISRKRSIRWDKTRVLLTEQLRKIPDFEAKMHWECDCKYIPFLGLIAPKDTCNIRKKGDSLTISLGVIGWDKSRLKTGDFLGVFSNSEILLLDKANDKAIRLTDYHYEERDLDGLVDKALNNSKLEEKATELKAEKTRFEVLKNLKGEAIKEIVEDYLTYKYEIKGELLIKKRALQGQKPFVITEKPPSFKAYFSQVKKQGIFSYNYNNSTKSFNLITRLLEAYKASQNPFTEALKGGISSLQSRSKAINATLWMVKDFALNFQHIIPILEVLGHFSYSFTQFKDFLQTFDYKSHFPIKVTIPLVFSIYATITFSKIVLLPSETPLLDEPPFENEESEGSLEQAHQKFNSLLRIRNKTSVNSDYFNIFEEKNEENIPEEDSSLPNAQPPLYIHNTKLKTLSSKYLLDRTKEERVFIQPNIQHIIRNAIQYNKAFIKEGSFHRNKETVVWNEGTCYKGQGIDRNFQELDQVLLERMRSKSEMGKDNRKKLRDVDVKLNRK